MRNKRVIKIVGIILVAVLCLTAFLLSPVFKIQSVTVGQSRFYTQEELEDFLSGVRNRNYFSVLFSNIPFSHLDYLFDVRLYHQEQMLLGDKPYIKTAEITCDFPHTVHLQFVERTPIFLVKFQGNYLLIDNEGYVLEAFSQEEKPDYPVVEGLDVTGYKTGRSLKSKSASGKLELAIMLCDLMEQSDFLDGYIDIIDITNENSIWMFAGPSLSVKFGDGTNLAMKVSTLKGIFLSGYDGQSGGTVDFTSGKNPIFKYNEKDQENE